MLSSNGMIYEYKEHLARIGSKASYTNMDVTSERFRERERERERECVCVCVWSEFIRNIISCGELEGKYDCRNV
jgi:hypothetical protein